MNQSYNKLKNISVQEQYYMANKGISLIDIDPYNLLDTKPLSLDVLLEKYSILRVKNHPDKGGQPNNFITINNSISNIKEILRALDSDKQFNNLRSGFYDTIKNENNGKIMADLFKNDAFDVKKFNKLFDEYKFEDNDDGYGSIMNNNEKMPIVKKINFKNFQEEFNKNKISKSKSLVVHKIPEAFNENDFNLIGEMNNYTKNGICDYKDAFDESKLINDNQSINHKTFEEVKKERQNDLSEIVNMTYDEKDIYERQQNEKKDREWRRRKNIDSYDKKAEIYSKKMNNFFIQK